PRRNCRAPSSSGRTRMPWRAPSSPTAPRTEPVSSRRCDGSKEVDPVPDQVRFQVSTHALRGASRAGLCWRRARQSPSWRLELLTMSVPNGIVRVALAAFVPFVLGCLMHVRPRHAVLVSLSAGWLFLPTFDDAYPLPLLHAKIMFVPAVVFFASLAFDGSRWRRFRPRLLDLAMAVLCFAPLLSSLVNDLGPYDGGSAVFEMSMIWGVPYLLGRVYFNEPGALRDLAVAIVAATSVYVPFCLWEVRM